MNYELTFGILVLCSVGAFVAGVKAVDSWRIWRKK